MGDGLHHAHVQAEGVFDDLLSVAGGGGGADVNVREFLVELCQKVPHQGHRVAGVGQIPGEDDLLLGVDCHGLHRGGAGVHAHIGDVIRKQGGVGGDAVLLVALDKLLILLLVVEEGGAALVVVAGTVVGDALGDLRQVKFLPGPGKGRACRHIVQRVFRADAGEAQDAVKCGPQLGEEGERPAQVHHLALNLPALGQACNGLVHHGGEDAGGNVVLLGALVEQSLNVAFGEHPAPGGDAVGPLAFFCNGVELLGGDGEQSGHLVDEGPGASGAGAVHAHFHRAGQEQNLGVLAAQLDDHVRIGYVLFHSGAGGVHLLGKGDVQIFRQAHACRAGHTQSGPLFLWELLLNPLQHARGFLRNLGVVPLVLLIHRLVLPVVYHALQCGGTHVQTNFHNCSINHPFPGCQSRPAAHHAPCPSPWERRGCITKIYRKISRITAFLRIYRNLRNAKSPSKFVPYHTTIFPHKNQSFVENRDLAISSFFPALWGEKNRDWPGKQVLFS